MSQASLRCAVRRDGCAPSPTANNRRLRALEFIRRYFGEYGASPSYSEIGAALALPSSRIGRILDELEHAGMILRTPGKARGIRLPERIDEISTSEACLILKRLGFVVYPPHSQEPL